MQQKSVCRASARARGGGGGGGEKKEKKFHTHTSRFVHGSVQEVDDGDTLSARVGDEKITRKLAVQHVPEQGLRAEVTGLVGDGESIKDGSSTYLLRLLSTEILLLGSHVVVPDQREERVAAIPHPVDPILLLDNRCWVGNDNQHRNRERNEHRRSVVCIRASVHWFGAT